VLTKGLGHSTALRINRCERFPVRKLDPKKRRAVVKGRSWLIMFKIPAKMPGMRGWLQGVCARGGSMKALAHVRTGSNAVVTRVPMVRAVAGSVLVRPGLAWPGFGLSGIGGGAGGARRMGEGMGKRAMSETAPVAPEIGTELDALPETIRRMLSLENASQVHPAEDCRSTQS
jgi:hypothetical protein